MIGFVSRVWGSIDCFGVGIEAGFFSPVDLYHICFFLLFCVT